MNLTKLKQAIDAAGGIRAVADACRLSHEAVRKWTKKGLPRTEWTGETCYAQTIGAMQSIHSATDLLERPLKE